VFIVVEGIDGSGKSALVAGLVERVSSSAEFGEPLALREPGGAVLGNVLRDILKNRTDIPIHQTAELLLFSAARAQLVREVIQPALIRGDTVICDRYIYSSIAYQGAGRGIAIADIEWLNRFATGGVLPDLVLLLDAPVAVAQSRRAAPEPDRFDSLASEFHETVRQNFLWQARESPELWHILDAGQSLHDVAEAAWTAVLRRKQRN